MGCLNNIRKSSQNNNPAEENKNKIQMMNSEGSLTHLNHKNIGMQNNYINDENKNCQQIIINQYNSNFELNRHEENNCDDRIINQDEDKQGKKGKSLNKITKNKKKKSNENSNINNKVENKKEILSLNQKKDIELLDKELETLNDKLNQRKKELKNLEEKCENKNKELNIIKNDINNSNKELKQLNDAKIELTNKNEEIQKLKDKYETEKNGALQKIKESKDEIKKLEDEIKNLTQSKKVLEQTNEELNKKNEELNKKNEELNKKNEELNKKNDEIKKIDEEYNNKNIELDIIKKDIDKLKLELEKMNKTKTELTKLNEDLQKKVDELKLNTQENDIKKLDKKLKEKEEELNKCRNDINKSKEELSKYDQKLNLRKEELNKLFSDINNSKEELIKYGKKLSQRKEEMNKFYSEYQKGLENLKQKENQIVIKNKELILKENELIKREKELEGKKEPILIGLNNIGATCYMNASLQCLSNTRKLTDYFLKFYKPNSNQIMVNEYYMVLKNLWNKDSNNKSYSPNSFKEVLSKLNPLFEGIAANDSKDLINFLLERFHQELNKVNKNLIDDNNMMSMQDQSNEQLMLKLFLEEFKQKFNSPISNLMYGILETKSQCQGCNVIKFNFQIYSFLEFPLQQVNTFFYNKGKRPLFTMDGKNPDIDLYECFEYNQKIDLMSGENQMFCNICNKLCNSLYSTILYSGPNYLIINLNRGKGAVYECKVFFPEQLNLYNYVTYKHGITVYELYAVICHLGPSSMSGHFVAYCRNRIDNKWYLYNDAFVTLCTKQNQYNEGMPYILFYKALVSGQNSEY